QAHETSADSADAAAETDGISAFLLHLQADINSGLRGAGLDFRVFVLDFLEISELVEAEKTHIPELGVEDLPFVDQNLAADDLVTRRRVSTERNAVHR